jgi:hypothetical protein
MPSNLKGKHWPQYQFSPTSKCTHDSYVPSLISLCTCISTAANFLPLIAMCLHWSCYGHTKLLDETDLPRLFYIPTDPWQTIVPTKKIIYSHPVTMHATKIFRLFLLFVCYTDWKQSHEFTFHACMTPLNPNIIVMSSNYAAKIILNLDGLKTNVWLRNMWHPSCMHESSQSHARSKRMINSNTIVMTERLDYK